MSAKKIGHRRQTTTPATPATPAPTIDTRYVDIAVAAPRFTSASDKLARSQREQIKQHSRGDVRPSCRSNGHGYYAERLHTRSTRVDARGSIYTVVCN